MSAAPVALCLQLCACWKLLHDDADDDTASGCMLAAGCNISFLLLLCWCTVLAVASAVEHRLYTFPCRTHVLWSSVVGCSCQPAKPPTCGACYRDCCCISAGLLATPATNSPQLTFSVAEQAISC
ncbi:hypothetical protein COO60DRAFT_357281 [Scenedesmus sp. NREL 46B-D3]|nr:hypothetical protein COO60DRAFT_357281 [Scenedesmus sp. NREL 46B-D3]